MNLIHISYRGYKMGLKLVEEFLAKSGTESCADFRQTAETIAKVTHFSD